MMWIFYKWLSKFLTLREGIQLCALLTQLLPSGASCLLIGLFKLRAFAVVWGHDVLIQLLLFRSTFITLFSLLSWVNGLISHSVSVVLHLSWNENWFYLMLVLLLLIAMFPDAAIRASHVESIVNLRDFLVCWHHVTYFLMKIPLNFFRKPNMLSWFEAVLHSHKRYWVKPKCDWSLTVDVIHSGLQHSAQNLLVFLLSHFFLS